MNRETALRIQAAADGELAGRELHRATEWLAQDPAAQALHEELQTVRALLAQAEPDVRVPESREFYWSKIARAIRQETPRPPRRAAAWTAWLLRYAVPAGALIALLAALWFKSSLDSPLSGPSFFASGEEVETPLENASAYTFWSESAHMTVVWVDTRLN
jgi:anti-sigma factor RsiW